MAALHEVGLMTDKDGRVAWKNWGEENPEFLLSAHWHMVCICTEYEFKPEAIQEYLRQSVKHAEVTRVQRGDVARYEGFLDASPLYRVFYPFGDDELPELMVGLIGHMEDRVRAYEQLHAAADLLVPEKTELVFETQRTEEPNENRNQYAAPPEGTHEPGIVCGHDGETITLRKAERRCVGEDCRNED